MRHKKNVLLKITAKYIAKVSGCKTFFKKISVLYFLNLVKNSGLIFEPFQVLLILWYS